MHKIVLHIGKACYHLGVALLSLAQRLIKWGKAKAEKTNNEEENSNG